MSAERLTEHDCHEIIMDTFAEGESIKLQMYKIARTAYARGLQRAADHMAATYGRCNLLTGTGYRNGDEVFDNLDREREGGGDVQR